MWILIIVIIVAGFFSWLNQRNNTDKEMDEIIKGENAVKEVETANDDISRSFVVADEALKQIGCQPEVLEKNEIGVAYQGENFVIVCNDVHARFWDLGWTSFNKSDPNYNKIIEAIGKANLCFGPTIVYSEPDENGDITVSSRYDVMIGFKFPQMQYYIKSILDSFFNIKYDFKKEYNETEIKQKEEIKKRNPIGFGTTAH